MISISNDILQKNQWHIQKLADIYDKNKNQEFKPYVIGYCPVCDLQRYLTYYSQNKSYFFFECSFCKNNNGRG